MRLGRRENTVQYINLGRADPSVQFAFSISGTGMRILGRATRLFAGVHV